MTERKEELANAFTHGLGVILFVVLAPILIGYAHRNSKETWPVIVYASCLLLMYMNSTFYHSATDGERKKTLRILDHVSIFLLIGGTFTPFVVYNMGNWNGLPFLAGFWGIMGCGIIFKIFSTGKYKLVSTFIYVGVAWIGAMLTWPLFPNMPRAVIIFIIIGGLFYTGGTFFYMKKQLLYHHAIWHLFVLAGSVSHFFAICLSI
jgi:hemolysin III